jgi:hypothetical protein
MKEYKAHGLPDKELFCIHFGTTAQIILASCDFGLISFIDSCFSSK